MWCAGNSSSQEGLTKENDYQQERLWMQGMENKKQKPEPVRTEGPLVFLIFVYMGMEEGMEIRVSLNTIIFIGLGFQAFFGCGRDYGRSESTGDR